MSKKDIMIKKTARRDFQGIPQQNLFKSSHFSVCGGYLVQLESLVEKKKQRLMNIAQMDLQHYDLI